MIKTIEGAVARGHHIEGMFEAVARIGRKPVRCQLERALHDSLDAAHPSQQEAWRRVLTVFNFR